MKECKLCKITKSLDEFHKEKTNPDGKESRCKVCILEMKSRNYYKNHTENREKARVKALAFRQKNKGYQRKYDLKRIYGLTLDDYEQMLVSQNHCCKICESSDAGGVHNKFYVDHCHKTGKVRGLLCTGCNLGLGAFKDKPENLLKAIEYLNINKE